MIRSILPTIALVAALTTGASAFAQDTMSVTVDYSDLNLGSTAGAEVFHRRLQNAVEQICGSTNVRELNTLSLVRKCQRETWSNTVQAERQAMAAFRRPTQMAAATQNPFAR